MMCKLLLRRQVLAMAHIPVKRKQRGLMKEVNRPYNGFESRLDGLATQSEFTVSVWEFDGK